MVIENVPGLTLEDSRRYHVLAPPGLTLLPLVCKQNLEIDELKATKPTSTNVTNVITNVEKRNDGETLGADFALSAGR